MSVTFQSWDHVANFMKKFSASKGHGIRIGGGNKQQMNYLSELICTAMPEKPGLIKRSKGYLEATKFIDQHIGHECYPSASQFVPTL
ncbi:hypothetical protein RhiirC2_797383 [Rhizophagus irregularis]|uniref:Uncharacterized protein n=1 Tax=Rhizophagus irregularis TaxID=588596 RepID=A0A2N1M841_9GLOM|nr:hypothetical protein RhiirC2_797383 [Rhizophagus irregularis]